MPVDDGVSNPSSNRPFADVLAARMSRRSVMTGSLATAAVAFFAQPGLAEAARGGGGGGRRGPLITFDRAANPDVDPASPVPSISGDYEYQVVIPWGAPLAAGVPDLVAPTERTAFWDRPDQRVGIGHDGMWFFPLGDGNDRGVLCINHEFGSNFHVLGVPGEAESLEQVRVSQAVHGVSVIELARDGSGTWNVVLPSAYNRRVTANTPMTADGPAASSPLLGDPARPTLGTVNNCANGYTPWGTYLTCEENFNGYFGWTDPNYVPTAQQDRYGFSGAGFDYGWRLHDPRFDLSSGAAPMEENRFGWIVEIDPMDASAVPVKHTALGRFKHEGIAMTVGRGGRAVGYMGDDERFDYIYKFVSAKNWRSMRARGISPLSEGTLYVARFDDDGTGEWLELSERNPALAGWSTDEILVYTRLAADALGATPMDRPEWTSVAPDGTVYCTLTNNTRRTEPNAANPLAPNPDGHIIRWRDADRHVGTTFEWDIFLFAKDTRGTDNDFTDPDGLWADPDGRIFIETDGGQPRGNNQMLVADSETAQVRRLFAGVAGDEITGLTVTPDRRPSFRNTPHPRNGDPGATNFPGPNEPAQPDGPIPRDCTFVLTRKDGGIVGS